MRLLDLFCGAGGAAMGYSRAGFEVVGVDIKPQPNYPFEFIEADALRYVNARLAKWAVYPDYDAIHASPPCQFATTYGRTGLVAAAQNLIYQTRQLLDRTGLSYVIENVEEARPYLKHPLLLCGSMFEGQGMYAVKRHRLFETNWRLVNHEWPCRHKVWAPGRYPASTNRSTGSRRTMQVGQWSIPLAEQKAGMGVNWDCTLGELSQMVPPAYTQFIGEQLLACIQGNTLLIPIENTV